MKYLKCALQFKLHSKSWYQVSARYRHFLPFSEKYQSLDKIICDVTSERKYFETIPNFETNIQKCIEYNGTGGRGLKSNIKKTVLTAYNMMDTSEKNTAESNRQAFVLAWAAQMIHSYEILRYRENGSKDGLENKSEASKKFVNDADLLRSFIYVVIEQHFQDTKFYRDILRLYNKAFLFTVIGHYLEHSSRKQTNTYANINPSQYEKLCDYKVSYPYFQLPISLALTLANKTDIMELLGGVGRICSEMGMLYQIQEDFENCFGTEAMLETRGDDIQKGRCTWLVVTALQRFTPRQRVVFETCYGSEEPAHVERVKLLYKQLQLPKLYREKEGSLRESIMQQAETLEKNGIPSKLFAELLGAINTQ